LYAAVTNISAVTHSRGLANLHSKRLEEAISDFTEGIRLDPLNTRNYNNRGNVYAHNKQFELAIEDYSRAISLNPKYVKALKNRGKAHYLLNQYDEALDDFTSVIEMAPHDEAEAFNKRAAILVKNGQLSRALQDLERSYNHRNASVLYKQKKDVYRWVISG
jgi:tetratricopeptide (TPR) repeat protein